MNSSYNRHVMEARNRPPGLLVRNLIDQILNKRNDEVQHMRRREQNRDRRCLGPDDAELLRQQSQTTLIWDGDNYLGSIS